MKNNVKERNEQIVVETLFFTATTNNIEMTNSISRRRQLYSNTPLKLLASVCLFWLLPLTLHQRNDQGFSEKLLVDQGRDIKEYVRHRDLMIVSI